MKFLKQKSNSGQKEKIISDEGSKLSPSERSKSRLCWLDHIMRVKEHMMHKVLYNPEVRRN